MERLLRFAALALCGATLVWLAGCSESADKPADSGPSTDELVALMEQKSAEVKAEEKAAEEAAAAAERERLMNEAPSEVGKGDYQRGAVLRDGNKSQFNRAMGGALAAATNVELQNIQRQLEIHGLAQGYPKSHEEFLKLVTEEWGMKLPELKDGYGYWYDADTHKILKLPQVQIDARRAAAEE